jgi:hypothetical protein
VFAIPEDDLARRRPLRASSLLLLLPALPSHELLMCKEDLIPIQPLGARTGEHGFRPDELARKCDLGLDGHIIGRVDHGSRM